MSGNGRKGTCPCGSGEVFNRCCLDLPPSPAHQLEVRLRGKLCNFAKQVRGSRWLKQASEELKLELDDHEVFESWYWNLVCYHYSGPTDDQPTLFESFLATRPRLSAEEKTLVWAFRQARVSIFRILEIQAGQAVLMEDQLCPAQAWVAEPALAEPDMVNAVILGRLAQVGQEVVLAGMYVRPMAAWKAQMIVQEMRAEAALSLSPELLRQPKWVRRLSERWRLGFQELDECSMPLLVTAEGEELCWVRDRYIFPAEEYGNVRQALEQFPELYWESPREARWIVGPSELGYLAFQENSLVLECNSEGRAERLGENLVALAIPGLKRARRIRRGIHSDGRTRQGLLRDEAIRRAYLHWSRQWPEEALPGLGGLTPRQAMRSAVGRRQVEAMLHEFEFYQATLSPAQAISLDGIRQQLGLPLPD